MRLIENRPDSIVPVLKDFIIKEEFKNLKNQKILEITLMAVKKDFQNQSHEISMELMKKYYQFAREYGFDQAVMAADQRLFRLLKRLGFVIEQIAESKHYEGSVTIPGVIDLNKTEKVLQKTKPELFNYFTNKEQ